MKRLIVLAIFLVGGCSFAPKYQRPPLIVPPAYKESGQWLKASPSSAELDRGPWWLMFGDADLNHLESLIDCGNFSLKAALARVDEARAILDQERAALYPEILGVFNANRQQLSKNTANVPRHSLFNDFLLSMNITYELDVWGRVRNAVASAGSLARASAADMAVIELSLRAELASDYFTLRGYDAAQHILDQTVVMYKKNLYIIQQQYRGGAIPINDLDQALFQLNNAKTLAADNRLKRSQLEHAIAVLVGLPPAAFTLPPKSVKFKLVTLTPQMPSTLLERRPDVAEQELRMQAANFNIGVARAAFFPAFNLSTAIGFESRMISNLLKGSSLIWALGPTTASALLNNGSMPLVTQTIFDGGRLVALSHQASAQYWQAAANYQQTVLTAYQEVEDSLTAIRQLDQENQTQALAAEEARRSLEQSMYTYRGGLTIYTDVVVFQSFSLQADLTLVDIRVRRQLASVQLIKALGGGFKEFP